MSRSTPERRLWPLLASAILAWAIAPSRADAGRRAFLFVNDSEIVPEGDVELEQWWWSESRIDPNDQGRPNGRSALYWIWSAPVIGLSNHLELTLPFQISASANNTSLQTLSAEASYRFFSREKDAGFQPLLRAGYHHTVQGRNPSTIEVDLVLAYGKPNELHLALNVGALISLPYPEPQPAQPFKPNASAGVSYPLTPGGEFRLAAELLAEFQVFQHTTSPNFPRYFAGGAFSWTRGRVWITAGTMVGLTGLSSASPPFIPRLLWAVAL